jgi:hypothetical protein
MLAGSAMGKHGAAAAHSLSTEKIQKNANIYT